MPPNAGAEAELGSLRLQNLEVQAEFNGEGAVRYLAGEHRVLLRDRWPAIVVFVMLATGCGKETAAPSDGAFSYPPGRIAIYGTATVAAGLTYSSSASLWVVMSPADVPFDGEACAAPVIPGTLNDVWWKEATTVVRDDFPLPWGIGRLNEWPEVRVHVALVSDPMEAFRLAFAGFSPVVVGDLYGTTDVVRYTRCNPMWDYYDCPLLSHVPAQQVLLDRAFEGCGGRQGSCAFEQGERCRRWTSTSTTITIPYETECATAGGSPSVDDCPSEGRVGGCRMEEADGSFSTDWYYAPATVEEILDACVATGRLSYVEP